MIVIPYDRLPETKLARHAELRNYFCDIDAVEERTLDGWELHLCWSNDHDRYVDPNLKVGLEWWGKSTLSSDMVVSRRREGRILVTLYDTWTLYSWSRWLCSMPALADEPIVILHVDDHRDTDSPRLFLDQYGLRDPLSGLPFSVTEPESVRSSILSGAVGMASFVTPFLHAIPTTEIRHLRPLSRTKDTSDYEISLTEEQDTLIEPHAFRPAIRLRVRNRGTPGPAVQRITPYMDEWLADLAPRPLLLHIDMDYFNNRYNGDSDWRNQRFSFDPPLNTIIHQIDELTAALYDTGSARNIQDIVVALSPGFFPAEYWEPATIHLMSRLKQLHV